MTYKGRETPEGGWLSVSLLSLEEHVEWDGGWNSVDEETLTLGSSGE